MKFLLRISSYSRGSIGRPKPIGSENADLGIFAIVDNTIIKNRAVGALVNDRSSLLAKYAVLFLSFLLRS